jgi:RNA polymerase sigma factor (sigma-70 family)
MPAITRAFTRLDRLPDDELIRLTRRGDDRAFGEVWRRHATVGMAIARRTTSRIDSADLVSESFARMLQAIRNGGGPDTAVRSYLAVTIRSVAASWGRGLRHTIDIDDAPEPAYIDERFEALDELDRRSAATAAFRALPERWQRALWYSVVEGRSNAEIGELLHINATAAAMLTSRARAGLRKAWTGAAVVS